jgi:transposase
VPSLEQEDARRRSRERARLIVERSQHTSRIKGLLMTQGIRDFRNRREVGGYFGLTPSPWQSGGVRRDQGIAKSGNPRARRTAIELAWLWLRHQPGSALVRWFHDRVGEAKGRMRRIMLVAMARKLIVSLWRYVTEGPVPEGATLKT